MRSKKNILLMLCVNFLQGMVFYASIATLYREAAGVGIFEITVIESISLIVSLALELPWGFVADRIGYKTTMIVCAALFFVSKLVFWQADGFADFLAERLLLAVVISGLSGVDASILYLSAGEADSQRAFGWYDAAGTAGMLLSTLLYALLIGADYRLAALLTCVTYGVAAVLTLFLDEVRPETPERTSPIAAFRQSLHALRHVRGLLPLVLGEALFGVAVQNVSVFLNQLQYVRCGLTPSVIGLCALLTAAAGLCSPLSAPLTKRFKERPLGFALLLVGAVSCALPAFTANAVLSVSAVTALCLSAALFRPLSAALENRLVVTADRATALSVNALLADGVAAALNPAVGALAEAELSGALLLCAGLCLAACVGFARAAR